jgi:hypothetical protein
MAYATPPYDLAWAGIFIVSSEEVESYNVKERCQTIPPGNFFSFFIGPTTVRNWDLVDATFQLGKSCGNLRFKTETVGFDRYPTQQISSENLVTSLHVREVQVSEHIGQKCQKFISDIVPKKQDTLRPACKSGTVDYVCTSVNYGFY